MNQSTVLIVDDERSIRELLKLALEEDGFRVLTAEHGQAALEIVAHDHPDLILLDLMMPVMDGWTFYNRIRSHDSGGIPVVILSSADAEEARRDLGAETALSKPFEIDDVVDRVRGLLPA
jgi:DNA-binding response OmpR family regulator